MKKTIYTIILLAVSTALLSWAVPAIVKVATATSDRYPFVYYSSLQQRFMIRETVKGKLAHSDTKGLSYTREQFDSLTPLLSYRQLMLTGTMPDSILGVAVEPRLLASKSVIWKYSPRDIHRPDIGLYLMYEAMSGRTTLDPPVDVFRLTGKIEFIDKLTNKVNIDKSQAFQQRMTEEGFHFPAQGVWGNLSARKAYDEGYFVLDSEGQLFHVKMVNGRPYVRNTNAGENIDIVYFDILEVADKSIYGFILSREGALYTLNADGYGTSKFDIPNINIDEDGIMLMGNLFYKMVNVTTPENCTYYVLEAQSLQQHDRPYTVNARYNPWEMGSTIFFPLSVNLGNKYTDYVQPTLHFAGLTAFIAGLVMAAGYTLTLGRKESGTLRIAKSLLIFITGIPGFLASLIIK